MKVVTVVGARPQFIKAAAVSREIAARRAMQEVIVHTGQHYDHGMSAVFFEELGIPDPAYHLNVGSGSHGVQTGRMLAGIEQVLLDQKPDVVLVYGDTNSTIAGALAAAKLHIPVAHVEAGLRSFNRRMPEEVNRVMADHLSTLLFAPTAQSVHNLEAEGITAPAVRLVGDVMFDASIHARKHSSPIAPVRGFPQKYALATVHRAENTDDAALLSRILAALHRLARDLPVVLPLHPRTRAALQTAGLSITAPGMHCVDPVGYREMLQLEAGAAVVITDSGGVQKEAFFVGVPCLTLRGETEWVELVEAGWNRLLPPSDPDLAEKLREAALTASPGAERGPLYGGGRASHAIVEALESRPFG